MDSLIFLRLEAAERAQEVAQQEAQRLERTLLSEREQRILLEEALKQVQEQMKLQGAAAARQEVCQIYTYCGVPDPPCIS